jgi:phosphopantothenoylcysteine synthetase/decarboxylase
MKVLVTAGGTSEPIDGVRRITNTSTGATGGVIARAFAARGHDVVLIHAADAPLNDVDVDREVFVTFADL